MPELPEVETIARQLRGMVVGREVLGFTSAWEKLTEPEPPDLFAKRLRGRRICAVRRRGKLVVFELDGGDALVVSLRMTGKLLFSEDGAAPDRFVRGTVAFSDGTSLAFSDIRKFGRMAIVDLADIAPDAGAAARRGPMHATLGMEPLSRGFTTAWLRAFLRRRARAAIKPLLLDGRGIAGVGNIYAIEALWRARIHPLRKAGSLRPDEVARLREALVWVLRKGIRFGGASRRDYRDARGNEGRMQREFEAYGRAGEPCSRCGALVRRTVVGGRGTFHCPRCQRAPRP
ncbi:MAG TPA: bifunctional DNA-formamidopyrimidine glycosylase/DNA-(apurinic or apyrimidinic site) lyase [Candidatus Limnocylindria bacterium]|nr:bifunctional DNA-formamidopyrimidine glycosylase/DNA-(apurinic or apyrimidinic site) lyase [Candidatus Limnocylindria bacterium]